MGQKMTVPQVVRKLPVMYGNRKLITIVTRARYWTLLSAGKILFTLLHLVSLLSILILSSHTHLSLPSSPFSSGFPTTFCTNFSSPQCWLI